MRVHCDSVICNHMPEDSQFPSEEVHFIRGEKQFLVTEHVEDLSNMPKLYTFDDLMSGILWFPACNGGRHISPTHLQRSLASSSGDFLIFLRFGLPVHKSA